MIKHKGDWPISQRLYEFFHGRATAENLGVVTLQPEIWLALVRQVQKLESGEAWTQPALDPTPPEITATRSGPNAKS